MHQASMAQQPAARPQEPGNRQRPARKDPLERPASDASLSALQDAADQSAPVQAVMQLQQSADSGTAATTLQRVAIGGVMQMAYDDALRLESAHAVRNRLTKAVMAAGSAASKEIRWREAQKPSSPLAERAIEFQTAMQEQLQIFDRQFQVLKVWYDSQGHEKLTKNILKEKTLDDIEKGNAFYDRLINGAMASYKAEADKQFHRGEIQDELLLGYRASVAEDRNPREKILDTNIWSWGVNQAWIEGGAKNRANFTLDTGIGDTALGYLRYKSGAEFLDAINPENWPGGEANTLWHNRDDRPTWYALELSGLLDLGYRPNDEGTQLEPPEGAIKSISGGVQGTGVGAYIKDEG